MTNQPPKIAVFLLSILLPQRIFNNVIGDLVEEYELLQVNDKKQANAWFWRQSMETSMIYFTNLFTRTTTLKKLNIVLPLLLLFLAMLLIVWLSVEDSFEGYSVTMWDELLNGNIHIILFEAPFWDNVWNYIKAFAHVDLFIDLPSLILAPALIILLVILDKKLNFSALRMAAWGYSLMILPYVWTLIHLNSNAVPAKQVGPIIAIGLCTFIYMILPVSYLVNKKIKRQIEKESLSE